MLLLSLVAEAVNIRLIVRPIPDTAVWCWPDTVNYEVLTECSVPFFSVDNVDTW